MSQRQRRIPSNSAMGNQPRCAITSGWIRASRGGRSRSLCVGAGCGPVPSQALSASGSDRKESRTGARPRQRECLHSPDHRKHGGRPPRRLRVRFPFASAPLGRGHRSSTAPDSSPRRGRTSPPSRTCVPAISPQRKSTTWPYKSTFPDLRHGRRSALNRAEHVRTADEAALARVSVELEVGVQIDGGHPALHARGVVFPPPCMSPVSQQMK